MKVIRVIVIAALLLVPVGVLAQEEQPDLAPPGELNPNQLEQQQDPQPQQQNSPVVPPTPGQFSDETTEEAVERAARNQKAQNLLAKCESVKTRIGTHKDNFTKFEQKHESVISRVTSKLDQLGERIDANEATDATNLLTLIGSLKTEVESFETEVGEYEKEVDLLLQEECTDANSALQFYDALDALRKETKTLKQKRSEIRDLIAKQIKQELQSIKEQLSVNQEGGENGQ